MLVVGPAPLVAAELNTPRLITQTQSDEGGHITVSGALSLGGQTLAARPSPFVTAMPEVARTY